MNACMVLNSKKAVVLFQLILCSIAYRRGAPEEACTSMLPGHQSTPQKIESPYSIDLSDDEYTPGRVIKLTLNGKKPFRGFLVKAVPDSNHSGHAIGQLDVSEPSDTSLIAKTCYKNKAVTHGRMLLEEDLTDNQLKLKWTPPPELDHGNVVFIATFVQNFSTIWVNVTSDVLWNSIAPKPTRKNSYEPPRTLTTEIPPLRRPEITGWAPFCFSFITGIGTVIFIQHRIFVKASNSLNSYNILLLVALMLLNILCVIFPPLASQRLECMASFLFQMAALILFIISVVLLLFKRRLIFCDVLSRFSHLLASVYCWIYEVDGVTYSQKRSLFLLTVACATSQYIIHFILLGVQISQQKSELSSQKQPTLKMTPKSESRGLWRKIHASCESFMSSYQIEYLASDHSRAISWWLRSTLCIPVITIPFLVSFLLLLTNVWCP